MTSESTETVECPSCHAALGGELVARFKNESQVCVTATVSKGQDLPASSAVLLIDGTTKMLKAVARELGVRVEIYLRNIGYEDGELSVTLFMARISKTPKKASIAPPPPAQP